jgi:hypothetical protein
MSEQAEKPATDAGVAVRRKFMKGAALAGAAGAAYLVNFNAPRQPATVANAAGTSKFATGRAPFSTPVPSMLDPSSAALLTPPAAKLSKGDLLHLRNFAKGKGGTVVQVTAADLNSVEAAFDDRDNTVAVQMGFKPVASLDDRSGSQHAWVTFGVQPAHALTIACCCSCCPCCSCAASVTRPESIS